MIRRIPRRVCKWCVIGLHEKCEKVISVKARGVVIKVKCGCDICNSARLEDYEAGEKALCC
jgi:hypothetical protein